MLLSIDQYLVDITHKDVEVAAIRYYIRLSRKHLLPSCGRVTTEAALWSLHWLSWGRRRPCRLAWISCVNWWSFCMH